MGGVIFLSVRLAYAGGGDCHDFCVGAGSLFSVPIDGAVVVDPSSVNVLCLEMDSCVSADRDG